MIGWIHDKVKKKALNNIQNSLALFMQWNIKYFQITHQTDKRIPGISR